MIQAVFYQPLGNRFAHLWGAVTPVEASVLRWVYSLREDHHNECSK